MMRLGAAIDIAQKLEAEIEQLVTRISTNANVINETELIENPDFLFNILKAKLERLAILRFNIEEFFVKDKYAFRQRTRLENEVNSANAYSRIIKEVYEIRSKTLGIKTATTVVSVEAIQKLLDETLERLERLNEEYNETIWNVSIFINGEKELNNDEEQEEDVPQLADNNAIIIENNINNSSTPDLEPTQTPSPSPYERATIGEGTIIRPRR
jgi:hypothetical protein